VRLQLQEFRAALGNGSPEEKVAACREVDPEYSTPQAADAFIWFLLQKLLSNRRYLDAAMLQWPLTVFDPRPLETRRIFAAIESHAAVALIGGSGVSKSYSAIVWNYLDWCQDYLYTGCRLVSTTAGHAKANVWSTLCALHTAALVKPPVTPTAEFLGADPNNRHAGFRRVAIPEGDNGMAALKGFHGIRRPVPHPVYGVCYRARAFLDEGEDIPEGVWHGVDNALSTIDGVDMTKVMSAANPTKAESLFARNCEPQDGWSTVDPDKDLNWTSKQSWHVVRLDPAQSENVVRRKIIYPGFQSYEGWLRLREKEPKGNSLAYWTLGRGLYPPGGHQATMFPRALLDMAIGSYVFEGPTTPFGTIDLAFEEGGDDCPMMIGRYGLATGYIVPGKPGIIPFNEPRWVLQIDQWFMLVKGLSMTMAFRIKTKCRQIGITPEWLVLDRTSIGKGCWDILNQTWGYKYETEILGIVWGSSATEKKILDEEVDGANEYCADNIAELWYGTQRWMEAHYLKIAPHVDTSRLFAELTNRRYSQGSKGPKGHKRIAMEPKKEYKRRHDTSPDVADAFVQAVYLARMRGSERARLTVKVEATELPEDADYPYIDIT
jgi:hypothetical protein